jgi:hypothetical protein
MIRPFCSELRLGPDYVRGDVGCRSLLLAERAP